MGAYLQRVRALPGRGRFRTGVSLLAARRNTPDLPKPGLSEDRFILFVSFPYFGRSSERVPLGLRSESVKLSDFRCLGVGTSDRRSEEETGDTREMSVEAEGGDIGEMLVHQARYMTFDNNLMAIFRSKEDNAKDQVPLHRFQERIGAFRSMVHMIANRMNLELWVLENLQTSLSKLEEDIGQLISDVEARQCNEGMTRIPDGGPPSLRLQLPVFPTEDEKLNWDEYYKRARAHTTSLNSLSAALFALIRVTERQIIILQDLHAVLSTSYRAKAKHHEKGYLFRRNPFHKSIVPIPVLSENPEQIWPNTLDTIDEVVQERKSFIKKIKEIVENTEITRKILFGFFKSDNEATTVMKRTEDTMRNTQYILEQTQATTRETQGILVQQAQQTKTLSVFTVVTTAFLPLSFCTSYFGMNNIKEFNDHPLSRSDFWRITGPVCAVITLLAVIIILWGRPGVARSRRNARDKLSEKVDDIENQWQGYRTSRI